MERLWRGLLAIPWFGRLIPEPAPWYREWRVNRALYALAAVLAILPWILQLAVAGGYPGPIHAVLEDYLGTRSAFQSAVSGALGMALFWHDWVRGGLGMALEGALSRRQVFLAKLSLAFVTLGASNAVVALILIVGALSSGSPGVVGPIAITALLWLIVHMVALVIALAMSTAMGSLLFVALATGLVGGIPDFVALGWSGLMSLIYPFPQPLWVGPVFTAIQRFSPYAMYPDAHWSVLAYMVANVLAGMGILALGLRWWDRAPTERFSEAVYFPWLWNLFYALLAFPSSMVATVAVTQGPFSWMTLFWFIAFFVVGWLIWRWLIMTIGRISWQFQSTKAH